jgi:hypothetical protein
MANTTTLVTTNYRNYNAKAFMNTISNENLYMFAGEPDPWFAGIVPQAYDDVQQTVVEVYRSMLFGKQITPQNVMLMIPNYPVLLTALPTPCMTTRTLSSSRSSFLRHRERHRLFSCIQVPRQRERIAHRPSHLTSPTWTRRTTLT